MLEESGYLPRAAFLLDRLMGKVGLSGRAFIPLLSSFACAVPGIIATRTIQHPRDRLATIMIAPLMTCSARLPVYALIIGAFIPKQNIGFFNLQGLVLFALYIAGIVSAMLVAYVFKQFFARNRYTPLMMEMPNYHLPNLRSLLLGLWERARIFVARVGTVILAMMVVLWFLSTYPAPPAGAVGPAIQYSFAGQLGHALEVLLHPIGFNWQIAIALIPGMAAREVAVGALGTVYALSATGEELSVMLTPMIAASWSLPHRLVLAGLVCFCPAMHLDTDHGQTRNQFLESACCYAVLHVCAGLSGLFRNLPDRRVPDRRCMMLQEVIVAVIVSIAAASIILHYMPRSVRQAFRDRLIRLAHRRNWIWLERKLVVRKLTDVAYGDTCSACSACAPMPTHDDVVSSITPEQLRRTIQR